MWAIDLTHTSHSLAQTGIQQVCRSLARSLEAMNKGQAVVYDRYEKLWRVPDRRERSRLLPPEMASSSKRSASWTIYQAARGTLKRRLRFSSQPISAKGIVFPEIIGPDRSSILYQDPFTARLKKVALFYDAIPMKFPEWCAEQMVQHFPDYLHCLSGMDHVACISKTSERDLLKQWQRLKITPARTSVIPLGIPRGIDKKAKSDGKESPVVLCLGTLEKRKNHAAFLLAAEELWSKGLSFKLVLAGMMHRSMKAELNPLIAGLRAKGRPLEWTGAVDDQAVDSLLAEADLLACPSHYEGFGLPVLEALAHGVPVLTSTQGALSELVEGGGCRTCGTSREAIRDSLENLLLDPEQRRALAVQAGNRKIPTMKYTARSLAGLLDEVLHH